MKKTIAILLVAILAVSSVFAAFSGEAKLGFGGLRSAVRQSSALVETWTMAISASSTSLLM